MWALHAVLQAYKPLRTLQPTKWRTRVARVDQTLQTVSFKDVQAHEATPSLHPLRRSPCCLCLAGRISTNHTNTSLRVHTQPTLGLCAFCTQMHTYTTRTPTFLSLLVSSQWFSQCSVGGGCLENFKIGHARVQSNGCEGATRYGH